MTDLAEFLLARIGEDERIANMARPDDHLTTRDRSNLRVEMDNGYAHVAATSGRVLAECEAKRRIASLHPCDDCGMGDDPCDTLRLLALPYADHPDYREEWKP